MARRMYDSVNPNAIPADAQMVAGYINGTFRWPDSAWSRFTNAVKVRIATRANVNDGHVLDVEVGAAWPPAVAPGWVQMRRRAGVDPTVYCNQLNDWEPVRAEFRRVNVPEPHYWVARYDNRAGLPAGAVAKQYANPPLAGGHYDLSIVADHWPGVDQEDGMPTAEEIANAVWGWHIKFSSLPNNPGGPAWMHLEQGNLSAQQANAKLSALTDDEANIIAAVRQIVADDPDATVELTGEQVDQFADRVLAQLPEQVRAAVRAAFARAGQPEGGTT